VPAHAVSDDEQVELRVDEVVVLVVIALPADIGCGEKLELHAKRASPRIRLVARA
jgi:hypothetical protein